MIPLRDLLESNAEVLRGSLDTVVTGVATDSRLVQPGDLYVCLPGYAAAGGEQLSDRHLYVSDAHARGAGAFVVERAVEAGPAATVVRVPNAWRAAAVAAARFHRRPSSELAVVGITGTSGKTSSSYFVDAVLRAAGHRVARFGTIDYRFGERVLPADQTTPESPVVHGLLRSAVDAGCSAAVMEVSSHALELHRVGEVRFEAGVFTNLSRDHLNFHPDMDSYRAAKAKLFESLEATGAAIVNADDPAASAMLAATRAKAIRFGVEPSADVVASNVEVSMQGLRFLAETPSGRVEVRLAQLGDYNLHNALAAIAVGVRFGADLEAVAEALAAAEPVPGRFEVVDGNADVMVVVDYAHKPDALERLLAGARRLHPSRLITVFGCGGDRDRGKRALMGRISARASDLSVVTSDNPRSEDPQAIVDEILEGAREIDPALERHLVEVDRAKAIRAAVAAAQPGDIVVIAGKGHEPYQLVGDRRLDFDDREHARAALRARES